MQTKLRLDDKVKIHFRCNTVEEANDIKNELLEMGYNVELYRLKSHRKAGICSRVSE